MPNVTITVPEELKTEMDKYSEVSWSEICRNAISQYIAQRENPKPRIEVYIRSSRLYDFDYETGYPTLIMDFRIENKMNSGITVDRILTNTKTIDQDGKMIGFGPADNFRRKIIDPNSVGLATVRLAFTKEKLRELQNRFTSTLDCTVKCTLFIDGFKHEYQQEIPIQIPIDVLNNVIRKTLKTDQATRMG
jgi:hypothetical protein